MFLAIDPGISTGWAVADAAGVLVACGAGEEFPQPHCHAALGLGHLAVCKAVIERPQVYRAAKSKGDPNDLITLAIRVGRYQERLATAGVAVGLFLPTTWKGQIPKDIHHRNVNGQLTDPERLVAQRVAKLPGERGYNDDVWDAIAFVKWAVKAGVFAKLSP